MPRSTAHMVADPTRRDGATVSIYVQAWVYQHSEARLADRLVLLALADEADDDGTNAFPSQRRIAEKARLGQTTVRRSIEAREAAGEIVVHRPDRIGRGKFSTYTVLMGRTPAEAEEGIQSGHLSNAPKRAETRQREALTLRPIDP